MVTFTYTLSLLPVLASLAAADINGIDSRDMYDEIEHVMVDNDGFNNDAFINAVTPCSNYVGFASNATDRGEQTSAQWVRFIFHDFVTADVSAGTGGLDASLGYESDRIENAGLFVNDTLQFFRPTVSAYFSMSDNIALGLIASIATCGGSDSDIPMRTGRIDATEAGPSGVPEPETDLETTLAQFAAAGFNQSDTISATACGHSLGRIHYSNFPDIVPESFVTDTNLDGGEGFDTTPDVWDASVVTEYLDATGQFGGPLVTASNVSKRSDYRLYISDSNATVQAMATDLTFRDTCYSLFERMINTVPSTVSLSDPVTPLTWKAVDVALDIDTTGSVSLSAYIRNLYTTSSPTSVSYTTTTSAGNSTSETTSTIAGTGTSLYGNTTYFSLNTTISSPGVTSLNFEDVTYPINDQIFVLPEQSTVTQANDTFLIKAAALTSLVSTDSQMSAVLYVPTTVEGTITPQIVNTTITMSEYGTAGNYTLFEGSATVASSTNVIVKAVLGDQASRTVKSKIMVGGS